MTADRPNAVNTASANGVTFAQAARPSLRRLRDAAPRTLTRQRLVAVASFFVVYGLVLSVDPQSGGAPRSLAAIAGGVLMAVRLFLPAFAAVFLTIRIAPRRPVPRALLLGAAVLAGIAFGQWALAGTAEIVRLWREERLDLLTSSLPIVGVGLLALAIYLVQERDGAAQAALHEEGERQLDLDRQAAEAQLRILQSQIEPHFLFNGLAHVRRLYQTDPRAGRAMMNAFLHYLSAAAPVMGAQQIRLGEELDLAIAYLRIQKIRMGARLAFEIDVPEAVECAQIPPMTVTTLIENSVKHGLSVLPEGGSVCIRARERDGTLKVEIADTGQGFQADIGTGAGLANVRARLALLCGPSASLALSKNTPRGVVATIRLPARIGARDGK